MKERPILFSTSMVQAILKGKKTQTRRIIKFELNNLHTHYGSCPLPKENIKLLADWYFSGIREFKNSILTYDVQSDVDDYYTCDIKCPYGQVGDVLWVRETWCRPYLHDGGEDEYYYKADNIKPGSFKHRFIDGKWKPSIFMPREACRIKLEITNIRVERLQDISEQDAINEGIEQEFDTYLDYGCKFKTGSFYLSAINSYRSLWEMINGKDSWKLNPWVWCISFKKL